MPPRKPSKTDEFTDGCASEAADRKPAAGKLTTPPVVRSEGQRLLLAVQASLSEIGEQIGTHKVSVGEWRRGEKTPGPAMRAALEASYAIPRASWDLSPARVGAPDGTVEYPRTAGRVDERAEGDRELSTLEECNALIRSTKRAAAEGEALLPSERVKLNDTLAKLLALRARLERENDMLEDRIVREHPLWQRIKRVTLAALVKHPAAARDLIDAWRKVGEEA